MKGDSQDNSGIGFAMHQLIIIDRFLEIDSISQKIDLSDLFDLQRRIARDLARGDLKRASFAPSHTSDHLDVENQC